MPILRIDTDELLAYCDPLTQEVWAEAVGAVHEEEVRLAIHEGRTFSFPYGERFQTGNEWSHRDHVERIAWLAENWDDDPLCVCLASSWILLDGNHRLAAAKLLGLPVVQIHVQDDELGEALEFFPSALRLEP